MHVRMFGTDCSILIIYPECSSLWLPVQWGNVTGLQQPNVSFTKLPHQKGWVPHHNILAMATLASTHWWIVTLLWTLLRSPDELLWILTKKNTLKAGPCHLWDKRVGCFMGVGHRWEVLHSDGCRIPVVRWAGRRSRVYMLWEHPDPEGPRTLSGQEGRVGMGILYHGSMKHPDGSLQTLFFLTRLREKVQGLWPPISGGRL